MKQSPTFWCGHFGQTYENVYSFYLQRPRGPVPSFECDWLVAMTEKASRNVRIGCGRYQWKFDAAPPKLACRLVIAIVEMQVFPPSSASEVLSFLSHITYPWSSPAEIKAVAAGYPRFRPILERICQGDNDV